ncbi:hypothetical protein Asp14428_37070 [Actinoplanes sp. NBRC 14428]|nr:hypothetical protein Asp14428_37070 [Actinoplanes sp. NBRC 14428]
MPTRETLTALLLACGVDRASLGPWLAARERVAGRPAGPGPEAVALRNPRDLGVHAAIEVDGAPGALPAYVSRDADPQLRAALRAGGFILLVGASSVGKTRSAYEAARGELPDWTLVQPGSLADLDRIAGEPPADTVVWLDEIHGFIADGLDAPLVRRLTSAGRRTVLIGTLWPEHYLTYVAFADPRTPDGDPYKRERELLRHAHVVDIGPRLSGAETARAREKAAVDPRIAIALDSDAGLIQTLAAGPELVRRWQNAPSPYAHALITAAIDARRLGVAEPSAALLADAVPGYLSRPLRGDAPPDWFAASLAYATTRVHGATSPLGPVGREMGRVDGYRVADYLQHHALRTRAGQVLPPSLWRACLAHAADRRELLAVGCAAYDRAMPRTAGDFFRAAVRAGSAAALYTLISLLSEQGSGDAIEEAWRLGAAHGLPHARERLAALLEGEGRIANAEAVWREAAVDPGTAAEPLVGLLLRAGRLDDAWAEAAEHPGDLTSAAWSQLAEESAAAGRLEDAARAWGAASDRPDAPSRRARILRELGDPDAAVAVLEESIARGNWQSRETLVGLLDGLDRTAEAVRVLEEGRRRASSTAGISSPRT